jgi:CDP-diacylglycerol--glycerol-3-phosphate 3-phosphatidyltransferase
MSRGVSTARVAVVAIGGLVALAVLATALDGRRGAVAALGWLATSAAVFVGVSGLLWRYRDRNHPPGRPTATQATLGLATTLTLLRGWLFAAVAGCAVLVPAGPLAWLPALGYGAGTLLDLADGAIARARDRTTALGAHLDMAVDTTGFAVAPVVGVVWGRLPVWYLSLAAARYLFKLGRGWRRRRDRPVYDLPASRVRRPLAALQMVFLTVALAPLLPADVVALVAVVVLAPSLAVFVRDYLAVTGRLSASSEE